jgi:hypothetical protein
LPLYYSSLARAHRHSPANSNLFELDSTAQLPARLDPVKAGPLPAWPRPHRGYPVRRRLATWEGRLVVAGGDGDDAAGDVLRRVSLRSGPRARPGAGGGPARRQGRPDIECAPLSGSVGVLGTIDSMAILRLLFDRRVKQSCLMRLSVCAAPHAGRPRARSRCSTVNGDADPVLVAARSPPSAHDVEPAGARRSAIWLLGRLQADPLSLRSRAPQRRSGRAWEGQGFIGRRRAAATA